eukprot:TRINITY_DN9420_c0_g1_i6.p1 TRINITY_DN9420_c0_g1~~TRINITY_DN9420_c0_g1_i6.p1  ORF type:complete len:420 (-),score=33.99 TRINITY_DN9420_c0_g1_i6:611-1870(-)
MEAVRRCHAASCRLGYRMRRSSVASLRMELRTAQKAVDDTMRVIHSASLMAEEHRQQGHLDDLLSALSQPSSATRLEENQETQAKNAGSQTDHLLRSQVHGLACSKGTDNPNPDFVDQFELCVTVVGPELDNTAGIISGIDPNIRSKVTVNGMDLCHGELHWTTRQLLTSPSVECKLETWEVLEMSRRILAARKERYWKEIGMDGNRSVASTRAGSSVGRSIPESDLSDIEPDHSVDDGDEQETQPLRKKLKTAHTPLPEVLEVVVQEEDEDHLPAATPLEPAERAVLSVSSLKRYEFFHTEKYRLRCRIAAFEEVHICMQNTQLKTYRFLHTADFVRCPCCMGPLKWSEVLQEYNALRSKVEEVVARRGSPACATTDFERQLTKKSLLQNCDGGKALLFLELHRGKAGLSADPCKGGL